MKASALFLLVAGCSGNAAGDGGDADTDADADTDGDTDVDSDTDADTDTDTGTGTGTDTDTDTGTGSGTGSGTGTGSDTDTDTGTGAGDCGDETCADGELCATWDVGPRATSACGKACESDDDCTDPGEPTCCGPDRNEGICTPGGCACAWCE
jgi:hypothetical protein